MQPLPLAQLMEHFRRLPGIGPKTAARLAYHVLGMEREQALALANSIIEAKDRLHFCSTCFSLTDTDPCVICQSATRDHGLICVVEEPRDVAAMERTRGHDRSRGYQGTYHVLQGVLSPLDGIGPENIRVRELVERIQTGSVREVIMLRIRTLRGRSRPPTSLACSNRWHTGDADRSRLANGRRPGVCGRGNAGQGAGESTGNLAEKGWAVSDADYCRVCRGDRIDPVVGADSGFPVESGAETGLQWPDRRVGTVAGQLGRRAAGVRFADHGVDGVAGGLFGNSRRAVANFLLCIFSGQGDLRNVRIFFFF
jgi:recombination protein RecR